MIKVEKTTFKDIDAIQISNGRIKLIVTTGIGPRICYYGFEDRGNILRVCEKDYESKDNNDFKFYGGHRLWHSPEDEVRTYQADNLPVDVKMLKFGVKVSMIEKKTLLQKSMQIEMKDDGKVRIIHTIKNLSLFDIAYASWGITQLIPGGIAVFPQDKRKTGLLPNRQLVLWDYTDLSDDRLIFSKNLVMVRQDNIDKKLKIGSFNRDGNLSYFINGDLFVKEFDVSEGEYSDYGCNAEIFTNKDFIELETLSPMEEVEPNGEVSHTEVWSLIEKVPAPKIEKVHYAAHKETINV